MRTGRVTGAAGLTYVIGAAIENMELLGAPARGAPDAEIRAAFADRALAIVTTSAGAISLAAYVVFVAGMFALLRGDRWAVAALGGGLAGVALGAAGLVANALQIAGATPALYDMHLELRLLAGAFMALFLAATGVAVLRSGALPRPLGMLACAVAPTLLLAPAAVGHEGLAVAAVVAFGAHSLWIWLTALWLALGPAELVRRAGPAELVRRADPAELVRRAAFLVLVLAAGLIGLAMLIVPGATASFFAWGLAPAPLAAFAGGVYVGSAAVYAVGLRASWSEARGLVVAAAVLSVSVFAITLAHLDVFDLGRLQAWAWLVLFAGFSTIMAGLLVAGGPAPGPGERLEPWERGAFAAVAAPLAAAGVALWVDPAAVLDLPPLGGRFAGSWIVMLAVLAGWAALRGSRDEARLPALALVALPAGAFVAALRTSAGLDHLAVLAALLAVGLALNRDAPEGEPALQLGLDR